ncbi:hypothetical protein BN7_1056 [Wickerhamomyces ciferrii]|uniref:Thioesterase domain-containing protein n=1 Tax=Wickerhamomyces ciferrii (strain ATCC 14091 / BCRC 22168 / CBS 111 / JCM 3599 / NBRC 0793 / NRRL Y-1031 F-60-10) TaxID=1206466 RepID=K0K9C8_WICCF|nr:uncharacterized protein BN7_1056 [Wickerhamomyces ciferrii]CCH41515.1 hypothetical protein BN7_1056 [Wickerhamomyces ciferrii]
MSHYIKRVTFSTLAFATGFTAFARVWPENSKELNTRRITEQKAEILESIKKSPNYIQLLRNEDYTGDVHSSRIPRLHQSNHVSQGLLFGPQHLEIDPLVFTNEKDKELQAYYHLGERLTSYDGNIHNGVISTILDELLCFCGFPELPSKRGVTAKLSIDFNQHVQPNTTVLLKAKVKEVKGRKVIIGGHIETLDPNPIIIANANCVLVEPKWFKYFKWASLF